MKKYIKEPTRVKEGDHITIDLATMVAPKCDVNWGLWYCVTHRTVLDHGWALSDHTQSHKDCVIGWRCHEHDAIEVP